MTFYQELQLNQAGSKLMIQEAVGKAAKGLAPAGTSG